MVGIDDQKLIAVALEVYGGFSGSKANKVSYLFNHTEDFLKVTREQLLSIKTVSGSNIRLSGEEIDRIIQVSKSGKIRIDRDTAQNYISVVTDRFINRQIENIKEISLGKLNPNPFIAKSLNLKTPRELAEFNVYALAIRSIVTSMGFFIEQLLLSASDSVEKIKPGWDILKTDQNNTKHYIQVKSGPNDMDKDQIVSWIGMIRDAESRGDRGYIGVTYGRRDNETVTFTLMRQLMDDFDQETLIGRELWEFLSGDTAFLDLLLETLKETALSIMSTRSILDEIEVAVERVTEEFIDKFGDGEDGVKNYIRTIL
jgi:hypothetical protein